jgi:RNA polymerase sigma-70 factor (sigma-E family)
MLAEPEKVSGVVLGGMALSGEMDRFFTALYVSSACAVQPDPTSFRVGATSGRGVSVVPGEAHRGGATLQRSEEDEFLTFIRVRMERWRRAAYLLCHDWHTADDLVGIVVAKLYEHWRRVSAADNPDAYAQRVLTRAWIDERRRPWRREHPADALPDRGWTQSDRVGDRADLIGLLAQLGRKQRAVVVLRFYFDRSVEETAELLGISVGTVKSQSARALEALRALTQETGTPQ